ncbi:MAG: T9SS type A sorting domain-containing protein [Candidatus Kapabacteria bacterium]|nr:T9SS type A sorting domain-containing protein [Candidatus Kapabacteria bacterium]
MNVSLRTIVTFIVVVLTTLNVRSQTSIGDIVNAYAPVTSIVDANCASHVSVPSAAEFYPKDLVLIIQMKGAFQSGQYNVQGVGLSEFAVVASISGNTISLAYPLLNKYDVGGRVQIVRVPIYADADVTAQLRGRPWDGSSGGVIAIDVRGTLRLNANIVADGIGFRGGSTWRGSDRCSTMTANDGINSQTAAMKGETYVEPQSTNVSGRQELFSGGGGGVAHNSGGAGGGNGGAGGRGGAEYQGCSRFFDNGGIGGVSAPAIVGTTPRIRCGGAGGAGQVNDNVGTGGANGGGIIVIRCITLGGNGRRITANGDRPLADAQNDGAGGGGAGGSVMLMTQFVVGGVFVDANGGRGGNVRTGAMHGPGGGGGGGSFLFSAPNPFAGLTFSVAAGTNGRNVNQTNAVNQSYLATPGNDGQSSFGITILENKGQFPVLSVKAPADTVVCPGTPMTLNAVTTGTFQTVAWTLINGTVVSSTTELRFKATSTQRYIVSITDEYGCVIRDTVQVSVNNQWVIDFPTVNLSAPSCTSMMDTALWLFNNSLTNATIARVTSPTPGAVITFPSPVLLRPGERYRIPVAVTLPTNGTLVTTRIDAMITPCDTVVSADIVVRRNDRVFGVNPTQIAMQSIVVCTTTMRDTTVRFMFNGASVEVIDILGLGTSRVTSAKQFTTVAGVAVPVDVEWLPIVGATAGQIGFIVREGACLDTLWVSVDGPVTQPRIDVTSSVDVSTLILCENSRAEVDVEFTSADTTTWEVVDVNIVGSATSDLVTGARFVGRKTVRVDVVPTQVGPYEIVITVRLQPCDTTVTIRIRGNAVNVNSSGTPLLTFTERIVGRRQTLQAVYRNTGTADLRIGNVRAPQAPFAVIGTTPAVPCTLVPGQQLVVDVEITQRVGIHRDSVVVTIDTPCLGTLTTQLESEATARTVIAMSDIISGIGVLDTVPVLLLQLPEIDNALLGEFRVTVEWNARELHVRSGSDARSSWTSRMVGSKYVTDIIGTWTGSDTLALIPVTTLLSTSDVTDLMFVRDPGFFWTGQVSDVEYDDGTLVIADPCSGRKMRSVLLNGIGELRAEPLPARDALTLRLDDQRVHHINIEIVDVIGHVVLRQSVTIQREYVLDVGTLSAGTYMLRVTIEGEIRFVAIVIQ